MTKEQLKNEVAELDKQLEETNKKIFDLKCQHKYLEKKKKLANDELTRIAS